MKLILLFTAIFAACAGPGIFITYESWAKRTLKKLSLREKIAQMMIYHMNMNYLNIENPKWKEIQRLIETDGIGGIHLWGGEVGISLTMMNEMQRLSKVPILFDADIEYGMKSRFSGGTDLPHMMAIAATGNSKYAYEAGRIAAIEGLAVGIRWNFSPVVDVNNNPLNPIINIRSFGENPDSVSEYAIQFIRGQQENGMLTTAKHFPGHGDTQTDSHSDLANIPSDSARLWNLELKPFKAVIDAGVDAVMVAHIHAPDFQPNAETPASLSSFWIKNILKNKLGFKGAIVTDSMSMGGVTTNYSDTYALIQAINAGCDIIIENYHYEKSIDIVENAVQQGLITEQRIDEAALQMLQLKEKAGLDKQRYTDAIFTRRKFGSMSSKLIAEEISARSITLVKDEKKLIPFSSNKERLTVVDLYSHKYDHSQTRVTKQLSATGFNILYFPVDESDEDIYLDEIVNSIPENSTVLINAFPSPKARKNRIVLTERQTKLLNEINSKSKRVILISFGNPYLIQAFPDISTYLCAYTGNSVMQNAIVQALLGKAQISGILPVSIPGIAKAGHGIIVSEKPLIIENNKTSYTSKLKRVMPYEVNAEVDNIHKLLNESLLDSAWPGGVLLAAKDGKIFFHEAFGYHTYSKREKTHLDDIFDLASITKVVATTSAVMKLVDSGNLDLEEKVVNYIPEFKGLNSAQSELKSTVSVWQLLTHSSGLPPFKLFYKMGSNIEARLDSVFNTDLEYHPGEKTVYSDIGMIILGKISERISGKPLDEFVAEKIFDPLGMTTTFFNPPGNKIKRIVPTEIDQDGNLIVGYVHDENAHSIGGVTGHAGLFSTAYNLAIFSQMMLNQGSYQRVRIFNPETVELFTTRANAVEGSSRCLGWDSPDGFASGGVYLSDSSYGHTGFTGTSLWIDPPNRIFVILLTNAVHPNRNWKNPKYYDWRQRIHSAVYEALGFTQQNPNLKWRERWN